MRPLTRSRLEEPGGDWGLCFRKIFQHLKQISELIYLHVQIFSHGSDHVFSKAVETSYFSFKSWLVAFNLVGKT